jgi:hypothetical protein
VKFLDSGQGYLTGAALTNQLIIIIFVYLQSKGTDWLQLGMYYVKFLVIYNTVLLLIPHR